MKYFRMPCMNCDIKLISRAIQIYILCKKPGNPFPAFAEYEFFHG